MTGSHTLIRFLGHAAFWLETGGYRLLLDPFLVGNPAAVQDATTLQPEFILVTHGHSDHVGDTVEIARRSGAVVISNSEICDWLEPQGIKVHSQHLGGGYRHPFGYLKMTAALHGSALVDGSNGGNPGGFLLTTLDGHKYYFAGDTGLFGDMRLIGEEGLRLAVLPIGDNYTMGPEDALRAVRLLQPEIVIPMHYNTFPFLRQDPQKWKAEVEAQTAARVQILQPGEEMFL